MGDAESGERIPEQGDRHPMTRRTERTDVLGHHPAAPEARRGGLAVVRQLVSGRAVSSDQLAGRTRVDAAVDRRKIRPRHQIRERLDRLVEQLDERLVRLLFCRLGVLTAVGVGLNPIELTRLGDSPIALSTATTELREGANQGRQQGSDLGECVVGRRSIGWGGQRSLVRDRSHRRTGRCGRCGLRWRCGCRSGRGGLATARQ